MEDSVLEEVDRTIREVHARGNYTPGILCGANAYRRIIEEANLLHAYADIVHQPYEDGLVRMYNGVNIVTHENIPPDAIRAIEIQNNSIVRAEYSGGNVTLYCTDNLTQDNSGLLNWWLRRPSRAVVPDFDRLSAEYITEFNFGSTQTEHEDDSDISDECFMDILKGAESCVDS